MTGCALSSFFFPPYQRSFDRSWIDRNTKPFPDRLDDILFCRICAQLLDKVENLVRAFVSALGAAPPRKQTGNPLSLKRGFRGVERLPAHAECRRHFSHGLSIDTMPSQHLVADLH